MKRYQELSIKDTPEQILHLWEAVERLCNINTALFQFNEINTKVGTASEKVARISITSSNLLPSIVVLVISNDNGLSKVSVANIIPDKQSMNKLTMQEYNDILKYFKENVIDKIIKDFPNSNVEYLSDSYTIEECIPFSFTLFKSWISQYPLSYHAFDMERWHEFVSSLHQHNENLSLDAFENSLIQDYHWNEEEAEHFSSMMSDELELLKVYDRMR